MTQDTQSFIPGVCIPPQFIQENGGTYGELHPCALPNGVGIKVIIIFLPSSEQFKPIKGILTQHFSQQGLSGTPSSAGHGINALLPHPL